MKKIKFILRVIHSTLAAMIGVQKYDNLKHDFEQKSALPFIISGIIFGFIFVISIVLIVKFIV